jgi:hydroxymethylbilane synthase
VGQGALAVEVRTADSESASLVRALHHEPTMTCVRAERAFLRRLGGGCLAPATAHATLSGGRLEIEALVGRPDGRALLMERESGGPEDGESLGARLAERLLVAGGARILAAARGEGAAGAIPV